MMEQNTQNKMTKSSSQVVHTGDEVIHKSFPQIAQIHAELIIEIPLTSSSHR